MEEAERCDRLGILDSGRLVALGTPAELRGSIGGDCLTVQSPAPAELARRIGERLQVPARAVGGQVRIETQRGHEFVSRLMEAFGPEISSVALGKPTLEDVFVERTGHRFWDEEDGQSV
jgi:ABC-2 type transport system ATP-binding protein